jgi:DNA-directed RNA polymerase specialized sigma24 family protein
LAESPLSSPAGPRFLPQRLTLYAIVRHLCTDRLREKRRAPAMVYHYLGNFEDAEDVAQEAFVYAYVHQSGLRASAQDCRLLIM